MDVNKNYYEPFPVRLRLLFDETGVSQQEVADYVGVSRQAVAQWKDGKTIPDMNNFKKVSEFFKVPYEYLFGDTDSRVKENLALAQTLGLSDKAIGRMQEWAMEKPETEALSKSSEILSSMITDDDFDEFMKRTQQFIYEYVEHRIYEEQQNDINYMENELVQDKSLDLTEHEAEEYARSVGRRTVSAKDLSKFYRYQAVEAMERVLLHMPEEQYIVYHLTQERGNLNGEHSTTEK